MSISKNCYMGDYTDQKALQVVVAADDYSWLIKNHYLSCQDSEIFPEQLELENLKSAGSFNDRLKAIFFSITGRLKSGVRSLTKKRIFDICFAIVVMVLGLPIFLIITVITHFSSPGGIFFKQERLGRRGRIFYLYKFRSMYSNAESSGPQLSRADDPRITNWGRLIRRTRLDELPQFWNVLKGDMSIVGPRPERDFYVKRIVQKRPEYLVLQQLNPGITSFGQVHYGYAENVDQMCDRLDHDLQYIQHAGLRTDLQIIIKTVGVMVKGRGK